MRTRAPQLITAVAILVMLARIAVTYGVFNDVIDEPYHIGAGVGMLDSGRHVFGIQHPPLPRIVGAIPLVLSGVHDDIARQTTSIQPDLSAFEVGHRVLMHGKLPYWSALTRARAAMLVFPVIAVIYVFLLGRCLSGAITGCFAAVMFSTDPTLLGHSSWVTTDVAAAAGYLAATYHGIRLIARPTHLRALGTGVAIGLAIACKFSCALVVPALILLAATRWRRSARLVLPALVAAAAAFVSLWATYFFNVGTFRGLTVPMPALFLGVAELLHHNSMGHFTYFNGHVGQHGSWWYFPEAIALKSTIALLAGLGIAILVLVFSRHRQPQRMLCIVIPGIIFLGASMMSQINIGVRHVLPVIPFICLFIAMQLARRRAVLMGLLIAGAFVETIAVHPDYLSFFNRLAGGAGGGERFLLDSNLDWGQDQWRLRQWLGTNARGRVVTARSFGNPRLYEWPGEGFNLLPPDAPPQGLFAISRNFAYDVYPSPVPMSPIRRLQPIAHIGNSIDVYDLTAKAGSPE